MLHEHYITWGLRKNSIQNHQQLLYPVFSGMFKKDTLKGCSESEIRHKQQQFHKDDFSA